MMEPREFSGSSVEEALTSATVELGVTSDRLNYEVIEKGSSGFLGIGSKNAVIRVTLKSDDEERARAEAEAAAVNAESNFSPESIASSASEADSAATALDNSSASNADVAATALNNAAIAEDRTKASRRRGDDKPLDEEAVKARATEFLQNVFGAMGIEVELKLDYEDESHTLSIEMSGPEMGIIIGKRGATLDSLQYLTNLAINKKLDSYVRVKMDTEDYRHRRKATLENLAKNVAYKVKRTRRSVSLEAMNPYERRIIHYALQGDAYVTTYSEGEEPYRHVVVALK